MSEVLVLGYFVIAGLRVYALQPHVASRVIRKDVFFSLCLCLCVFVSVPAVIFRLTSDLLGPAGLPLGIIG